MWALTKSDRLEISSAYLYFGIFVILYDIRGLQWHGFFADTPNIDVISNNLVFIKHEELDNLEIIRFSDIIALNWLV